MGRVVTRGRRHRVLVRDDRGVVVGVAEALDLVQRIDVAGRPIGRREVHVDGHLALGLLRPQTRAILRKFSTFFLRSTAFRTLQEGYKRATKRSDPTPPVPSHYSYFGR